MPTACLQGIGHTSTESHNTTRQITYPQWHTSDRVYGKVLLTISYSLIFTSMPAFINTHGVTLVRYAAHAYNAHTKAHIPT